MNNIRNEDFSHNLHVVWNILSHTQSVNSPVAQGAITNMSQMLMRATQEELQGLSDYLAKKAFVGTTILQRGSYAQLGQVVVHLQRTGVDSEITRPMGKIIYNIYQVYKRSLPVHPPKPAIEEQVVQKLDALTLKAESDPEPPSVEYTRFLCNELVNIIASSCLIDDVFGKVEDEDDRVRCTYPLALIALYNLASSKNLLIAKEDGPLYALAAELYGLFTTNYQLAKTFPKTAEGVSALLFKVLYICFLPHDGDIKQVNEREDAQAVESMKAFLLDSCKEFHQQFIQKVAYEPALAVVVHENECTFAQAVEVAKHEEAVTGAQIEHVREYVADVKELINAAAIHDLLKTLENDPDVSPHVVTMLRKDWEESGNLIGKEIKDNSAVLTKERAREILRIAKEVSANSIINDLLDEAKRRLQEDVARGRVVLVPKLAIQYPAFYGLQKLKTLNSKQQALWATEFQKIVNDAYLHQELKKKQKPHGDDAYIENLILKEMGLIEEGDEKLEEVKGIKAQAEVEVMRRLLEGEGVEAESLEALEALLHKQKMEARLKAVGVNDEKAKQLVEILPKLEKERDELAMRAKPWQEVIVGLPKNFPAIACAFLLSGKKKWVSDELNRLFKRHIKSLSECLQKKRWGIFDLLAFGLPPGCRSAVKDGSQFASIDSRLLTYSAFHQKWGHRLISEMIQGLDDDDAVFHEGACLGINTRWVINEQKYPHLTAQEFACTVSVGSIRSRDRFRQLCHASQKFQGLITLVHGRWAPAFLKSEKIHDVHHLFGFHCDSAVDCVTALREGLDQSANRLSVSNGVLSLSIKSHIIYVRVDLKRGIFRLGDVNVGILDFSQSNNPLEELLDCFNDLILTTYKDNSRLDGFQFELER